MFCSEGPFGFLPTLTPLYLSGLSLLSTHSELQQHCFSACLPSGLLSRIWPCVIYTFINPICICVGTKEEKGGWTVREEGWGAVDFALSFSRTQLHCFTRDAILDQRALSVSQHLPSCWVSNNWNGVQP